MKDQFLTELNYPEKNSLSTEAKIHKYFEEPAIPWETISSSETNLALVYHATFSTVHIERRKELKDEKVLITQNGIGKADTGEFIVVPRTTEVAKELLEGEMETQLKKYDPETKKRIIDIYSKLHKDTLFGEYQPLNLKPMEEGTSIEPSKFITTLLMKFASERNSAKHSGDTFVVLHPDILFFLSEGNFNEIRTNAKLLGDLAEILKINVVYENIVFNKDIFRNNLHWMGDPTEMYEYFVKESKNSGICIDIKHLELEGWPEEKVVNTISFLGRKRDLPLTMQADMHSNTVTIDRSLLTAYILGIPIAYEERGI